MLKYQTRILWILIFVITALLFVWIADTDPQGKLDRHSWNPTLKNSISVLSNVTATVPNLPNPLKQILRRNHRGVAVPVLSASEFNGIPWSTQLRIVRRDSGGLNLYHNYTSYVDGHGKKREVFTVKEFLRDHTNIIHRRAFTVNYNFKPEDAPAYFSNAEEERKRVTWRWRGNKLNDVKSAVIIWLCYEGLDDFGFLTDYVHIAILRWHQALGPHRGVKFSILPQLYCKKDGQSDSDEWSDCFTPDMVRLKYVEGSTGLTSTGYYPWNEVGRHSMEFDPKAIRDVRESYGLITHEFGHILGLFHEHQRYDAGSEIKLYVDRLNNYAKAKQIYLDEGGDEEDWDDFATKDAAEAGNGPWGQAWAGSEFIPYKGGNIISEQGILWDYLEDDPPEGDTKVDFKSIMMYGSHDDSSNGQPVMTRLDGSTWEKEVFPSARDVAAVKKMYPDVEEIDVLDLNGDSDPASPDQNR